MMRPPHIVQAISAVLLILSGIAVAGFQVVTIQDVAKGSLWYIAQAFLLAGSLFGLDYYVNKIVDATSSFNKRATQ